ncbi:hypothetical protein [Paenibacillus sp. FSL R10-2736]|uniref:hypothetical protein n=1 Tax=Paenibacillus sp. FSL R10-2736 TaxID=2954692 RepID=UPI0030FA6DD2
MTDIGRTARIQREELTLNSALDTSGFVRLRSVTRNSGMNDVGWMFRDGCSGTNNPEQTGDLRTGKCVAEVAG